MCTAVNTHGLFGRTLDIERSFGESVALTPRALPLDFRHEGTLHKHLAILGMASVRGGVPLYYDAVNEEGLCMAALKFPENAVYHAPCADKHNVASFELIWWVLGKCKTLGQARELLSKTNVTNDDFAEDTKPSPLHYIVADGEAAIVVESVAHGLKIYENPLGVLTNNPPFCYHLEHVRGFMHLDSGYPENTLCEGVPLTPYSGGIAAVGLPGDFSSPSRFVRAVFAKGHTSLDGTQGERVSAFFHVLDTVSVPRGCEKNASGESLFTLYASCVDVSARAYFFTTYGSRRVRALTMDGVNLDSSTLICRDISGGEDVERLR